MALTILDSNLRDTLCDAFVDAIDAGTGAGIIRIYDNSTPRVLLAQLTFSDPAFGASSSGTATASAITADSSADATGTATEFEVATTNDGSTPLTTLFNGSVGTSGADINFNTVSFTTGDNISISSMTVTMPAS